MTGITFPCVYCGRIIEFGFLYYCEICMPYKNYKDFQKNECICPTCKTILRWKI